MRRALLVALIVGMAACSGTEATGTTAATTSSTTTTVTATTVAAPGTDSEYGSVEEIRQLIEATGFTCTTWEVRAGGPYSTEMADCTDSVVFSIHEDALQAAQAIKEKNDLMFSLLGEDAPDSIHVRGANWLISCGDRALCESWIPVVGGQLHVASPPVQVEFAPEDFTIELVVLESQCFNTAGALVTVEPELAINTIKPTAGQTLTIVYEIHGGENVETYNLEVEGTSYSYDEHTVSTETCEPELTAEVVDVISR